MTMIPTATLLIPVAWDASTDSMATGIPPSTVPIGVRLIGAATTDGMTHGTTPGIVHIMPDGMVDGMTHGVITTMFGDGPIMDMDGLEDGMLHIGIIPTTDLLAPAITLLAVSSRVVDARLAIAARLVPTQNVVAAIRSRAGLTTTVQTTATTITTDSERATIRIATTTTSNNHRRDQTTIIITTTTSAAVADRSVVALDLVATVARLAVEAQSAEAAIVAVALEVADNERPTVVRNI